MAEREIGSSSIGTSAAVTSDRRAASCTSAQGGVNGPEGPRKPLKSIMDIDTADVSTLKYVQSDT